MSHVSHYWVLLWTLRPSKSLKSIANREVSQNRSWLQSCRDKCLLDHSVSEDSKYTRDCLQRCLSLSELCFVTASETLCSFSLWLHLETSIHCQNGHHIKIKLSHNSKAQKLWYVILLLPFDVKTLKWSWVKPQCALCTIPRAALLQIPKF